MADFDVREKRFEQDIETFLCTHGGYLKGDPAAFDRKLALDTATWKPALVADIPSHATSPQMAEPNRVVASFHPLSVRQDSLGAWIFDMGKNLTGWTSISFPKLKKGQEIRIGYCDFLWCG